MAGRWATVDEAPVGKPGSPRGITMPMEMPNWALNHTAATVLNSAIYFGHAWLQSSGTMTPDRFFPLDAILESRFAAALDAADAALGGFDAVIVTAAMFATQAELEADVELTRRLTTANFANTVTFCEHVRKRLLARGRALHRGLQCHGRSRNCHSRARHDRRSHRAGIYVRGHRARAGLAGHHARVLRYRPGHPHARSGPGGSPRDAAHVRDHWRPPMGTSLRRRGPRGHRAAPAADTTVERPLMSAIVL